MLLFIVAENLFKAGNRTPLGGSAFEIYLEASAGTLHALAKQRNCILHYLVDNIYEQTEFGMRRPLKLYEGWFRSAGLVYICPQAIAISLMDHDKQDSSQYFTLLPEYISEGIDVAYQAVEKCHAEGRHYVFLNADSSDKPFSFECCLKTARSPGIVTAFRNEAPVVGSKISVIYPQNRQMSTRALRLLALTPFAMRCSVGYRNSEGPAVRHGRVSFAVRLSDYSSPEYRRCVRSFLTAIPNAFFCPIRTTNFLPRVIPV